MDIVILHLSLQLGVLMSKQEMSTGNILTNNGVYSESTLLSIVIYVFVGKHVPRIFVLGEHLVLLSRLFTMTLNLTNESIESIQICLF